MKKMIQKGFTLIELMIVVAIIAILAAIAIPAYQDYLIRSQVSEGASLVAGAKTAVSEYYSNFGAAPADNGAAGLAPAKNITGNYVSEVGVTKGVITAKFAGPKSHANIKAKALAFTPVFPDTTTGSTVWHCNPAKSAGTNVDPKYLPAICRN